VIHRRVIQAIVLHALMVLLPSSALAPEVRLLGPSVSLSSGYERTLDRSDESESEAPGLKCEPSASGRERCGLECEPAASECESVGWE
jgi:hypothetical protein